MTQGKLSPTRVQKLAALSREYHMVREELTTALLQETLENDHDAVAEKFGLTREQLTRYLPEHVLKVREGYIHRASLRSTSTVLAEVRKHLELGRLKPGDQFPPRTAFTEVYRCDKKTHAEVTAQLLVDGAVFRPGGNGGPLYVR
jgi:hypothetical protein